MKPDRIESLVSWLSVGAILICIGLFFLVRGWLLPQFGVDPVHSRHGVLDPQVAGVGAFVFVLIGIGLIARAVIGKLRKRP